MSDIADLLRTRLGTTAVDDSVETLDAYSHDTWPVATVQQKLGEHPHRPDLVVHVVDTAGVMVVLEHASTAGVPVTAWGLGSSVTGQPLPTRGGILMDTSGIVGEPELNSKDKTVRVPAGVRGSDLEAWLADRQLTLNHFPQSLGRSTVGGWIATRATGQFSSKFGGIEDLVIAYTVVLADGTVCQVGQRPRAAMGPDLKQLFIGSEGTLGIITEVTLKVFALPECVVLEAFTLPDIASGVDAMRNISQTGLRPHLVRLYDTDEARHALGRHDIDRPALFIGHQGPAAVADAEHSSSVQILKDLGAVSLGTEPVQAWLARRFDFSTIEKLLDQPGGYAETIEVANMWSRIEPMYAELKTALAPLADEVLGHFSHVYDQGSSLYVILLGHATTDREALSQLQEIWATAMQVVVKHDGEVSHHHGGGLARQPWARQSLGSGHVLLQRLKVALDPQHMLNPGKLGLET